MTEITDEMLSRLAHSMPHLPWGIGSRREDAFAFARAVAAEVYRAGYRHGTEDERAHASRAAAPTDKS